MVCITINNVGMFGNQTFPWGGVIPHLLYHGDLQVIASLNLLRMTSWFLTI